MPVTLERCAEMPAARVGGKARMLGEALLAGFPVPTGIVFEPGEDVDAGAVVAALGNGPFAVRSSSPHEDGGQASWAGQFRTRLWVNLAELPAAIDEVRASGAAAAARAYGGLSDAIPALVQPIVTADFAGVMFTIDPRDGRDDRCVVEAVAGLGEPLADGRAEPARYLVDALSEQLIDSAPTGRVCLAADQLAEVVALGLRVSEWRGEPLDVEWAWALGHAWLLQARPITAAHWAPAEGQWTAANFKEVMPGVVTPLTASMSLEHDFPGATSEFAADLGVIGRHERVTEGRRFYAHAYWRVDTMKDALLKLPGFRERAFDATVGISPAYDGDGRTGGLTLTTLRHALPAWRALRRAYSDDGPAAGRYRDTFAREEADWLGTNWESLADADLARRVQESIKQHWRTNRWAMRVSFLSEQAQDDLRSALARLRGRLDRPANEALLLSSLNELATGRAARALGELAARHERECDQVMAADTPGQLPEPLRQEFANLVATFGYMAEADEELSQPRWDEDSHIPFALLKAAIAAAARPDGGAARTSAGAAEERRVLAAAGWRARSVVRKIRLARKYAWWREELREVLMRTNRLTRLAFATLGRRWADRGLLESADDIFWLTAREVTDVLSGSLDIDRIAADVPRRRRHADRFRRWRPPETLGVAPQAAAPPADGTRSLKGTACSAGVVEGRVCILRSLEQATKVKPGSILVLEYSNPGWTPVYTVAAGLVTEEGGLLSHGSIIARERGLPAVIQVRDATRVLRDGQRVRLDGDRGNVLVLDEDD